MVIVLLKFNYLIRPNCQAAKWKCEIASQLTINALAKVIST